MNTDFDVIIIGGGASGMMTAITAGRRGKSVLLLEKRNELGKKLSVTGNGRCNITHDPISIEAYHSDHIKKAEKILSRFNLEDTRRFFEGIGVALYNKDGYVYPRSNEASSVVKCMTMALDEAGVTVMKGIAMNTIQKYDSDLTVSIKSGYEFHSKAIVLACGGMAAPDIGGSSYGVGLAAKLSHRVYPPFPALTDLHCDGLDFKKVKGVRVHGEVSIIMDDEVIAASIGEIQMTGEGISGIPVFNVSYEAVSGLNINKDMYAKIDLFPELTDEIDLILVEGL